MSIRDRLAAGFMRFAQGLGNIGKGEEWEAIWNARLTAMEAILGKCGDNVYHSPDPFYLGGDADVLVFEDYVKGFAYVTADLTGPSEQPPNSAGLNYELMMCTRGPVEWAPSYVSRLSRYTLTNIINPNETMDFRVSFGESELSALLWLAPDLSVDTFEVLGVPSTILLAVGITDGEIGLARSEGIDTLVSKLRTGGIFPFTDPGRASIA